MDNIDTARLQGITRRFLVSEGTSAITGMQVTDFDRLQVALHNTIMREYPELGTDVRFRIVMAVRVRPEDPLEVTVQVLRPVSEYKVAV